MKLLIVLFALVAYVSCNEANNHCYKQINAECRQNEGVSADVSCNAKYGTAFHDDHKVIHGLQKYATSHITRSFDYLLRSAHFGNFQKNREGFEKLFRNLADSTWDDAIDLIKYIGKRGGEMKFNVAEDAPAPPTIEINELASLAYALDVQKRLAEEAFDIHKKASHHMAGNKESKDRNVAYDPEVTFFLEEHFVHKQADTIRDLSGHTNDLKRLLKDGETSRLSVFLFDEYLQKL